jgi:nitrogen regulatory protein PII
VQGITVTEVKGFGRQKGHTELYRGAEYVVDFLPKVKIEAAVDDSIVDRVIEAIEAVGPHRQDRRRQGLRQTLEQVIRIRTGETGDARSDSEETTKNMKKLFASWPWAWPAAGLTGAALRTPPAAASEAASAVAAPLAEAARAAAMPPPQPAAEAPHRRRRSARVPNKGDTAWMMVSTLLVILMTVPGLALFYGGLVRSKNMLSVLMQVMVTFSLIVVLWVRLRLQPGVHRGQRLHRRLRPAVPRRASVRQRGRQLRDGGHLQQGRLHPRDRVRRLPGHLRRHHLLPDRRRLRRAHQVQRRAAVHGALVHLQLPAGRAHGVVLDGPGRLPPEVADAMNGKAGLIWGSGARWTSPAAPWCTSTPPWPAWWAPT